MLLSAIENIPQELIVRDNPLTLMVGLGMFLSFVLIALAKLVQADIYTVLPASFGKNKGLFSYLREKMPIQKAGSILLLLNYLISSSIIILMIVNYDNNTSLSTFWIFSIPICVILFHLVSLFFTGIVTGENGLIQTPILMKISGAQLLGLGNSILIFLMAMHFIEQKMFISLVVALFISENVIRVIRSLGFVLARGVSWYYLIMYLCTLEILPLFMTYYFVTAE